MNEALKKAEELLFKEYATVLNNELPMLFIIASPRTGSTLIYQLMINFFKVFYFSNFINDYFAEMPLVGLSIEYKINPQHLVDYKSAYGKTEGIYGPSEGSKIFKNWFGGQHPSQVSSSRVLPKKKQHMLQSLTGINGIADLPIITKNAWNCFRIKELTQLFKRIYFIWFRRDIGFSALSDLESRYRRGGPEVWNSATTANYKEIQKLPYWEQVVEQQYEYNRSMERDLNKYATDKYIEIWYEDICENFGSELKKIKKFFTSRTFPIKTRDIPNPRLKRSNKNNNLEEDKKKIFDYIHSNHERFLKYIRTDIS